MIKNGISEENLIKLFNHAQISSKEQDMIRNLNFLGINIIPEVSKQLINTMILSITIIREIFLLARKIK